MTDLSRGRDRAASAQLELWEQERLAELEAVVERGLATFMEVGAALMEIRNERYYRESHQTFDDYCRERWAMRREVADRYVRSAEVVAAINPIGLPLPANEAQARELAPLLDRPDELRAAWTEANAAGAPTAAVVRQAVQPHMAVHYSSDTDQWATPPDLFDLLDDEFDFQTDVCAIAQNAKCLEYYSPTQNGLTQTWTGRCWMNPPYGREIGEWVRKAWESSTRHGATVVCLIPARTDTSWWWDYARHGEVRFLRGRLRFGEASTGAPFPSAVVIFDGRPATVKWWDRWPTG